MGFFGEKISAFRASDQSLSLSIWSLLWISDFCLFLSVDEQKTRAQVTTIREWSEIKKKTWWTTKNLIEIEKKKFGLIIRFSRLLLLFRLNSPIRMAAFLKFFFVSTFVVLASSQQRVNNTCINNKLDSLHNTVFDNFEKTSALRTFSDARILSYTNESAEVMMLYSKYCYFMTRILKNFM